MIINDLKGTFKSMRFWIFTFFMFLLNIYCLYSKVSHDTSFSTLYQNMQIAIEDGYLDQFTLFSFSISKY